MKSLCGFVHGVFDTILVIWCFFASLVAWASYDNWKRDKKEKEEWEEAFERNENRDS